MPILARVDKRGQRGHMWDNWNTGEGVHIGMCQCFDGPRIAKFSDAVCLWDYDKVAEPKSRGYHGGIPVYVYSGDEGPLDIELPPQKPWVGSGIEFHLDY